MSYPDNNPKTAQGMKKVPLHLVPPSATHFLAMALADGARKYGPYNWREHAISTSVYVAACKRHVDAFWDGETLAEDSGVHHLAHAMACIALMLDAMTVGKLNDDRPLPGNVGALQSAWGKATVEVDRPVPFSVVSEHQAKWSADRAAAEAEAAALPYVPHTASPADRGDPRPKAPLRALSVQEWDGYLTALAAWGLRNPGD